MNDVRIAARPEPLDIEPGRTAVIVVDMQYGFFGPGGLWDRLGVELSGARAIVEPIARVLEMVRRAGMPVVYLTMDFTVPGTGGTRWSPARQGRWLADVGRRATSPLARELPPGMTDSDILAELAPRPGDATVVKPRHSGFYNTDLDAVLRDLGVNTLIFVGGTTSVCVESTLRDAYFRDYRCLLLTDCTAECIGSRFERRNHDATAHLVEVLFGWVAASGALVRALSVEVRP